MQVEARHTLIKRAIGVLSVMLCVFQIYTAATMPLTVLDQRSIHYGFALAILFLYSALNHMHLIMRLVDYALAIAGVGLNLFILLNWEDMAVRPTNMLPIEFVVGVVIVLITLEAARRQTGIWLPLIALVFILYAYIGPMLPGVLRFSGINLRRFLNSVSFGSEGIFGMCLGASATFAFMFVLFGEFLLKFGAGDFIIQLAQACMGRVRGGSAKIAILASSLFGSVSGSAIANVAGTGCITIPLMKKSGYPPEFAGAVEASASTGGQIMPPVMGSAAFVMAEMLGVSYGMICIAALIPAILYFSAVFIMVDLKAAKLGMKGQQVEDLPKLSAVLKEGWHYLIAIFVLILLFIVLQWSATKAAFGSLVALVVADWTRKFLTKQKIDIKLIYETFVDGAKAALTVATATACAGIIIGVFTATSLNIRFSSVLIALAGNNLFALLILAMVGAIILGMGLPTTPVYIILSVLIAPAMIQMGVLPLAAHMFLLYFGCMAPVTPPVGLGFYVAAGIAQSKPMATGLQAFMLSIAGFLMPFVFVYDPALLLEGSIPQILWAVLTCLTGTVGLACGLVGHFLREISVVKRVILIVAAIMSIIPEPISSYIGLGIIAAFLLLEVYLVKFSSSKMQAS